MIMAKIGISVEPFMIPNFVRRAKKSSAQGDDSDPAFPLRDVDADALSALCDQFRADVFKQAGKTDPRLK